MRERVGLPGSGAGDDEERVPPCIANTVRRCCPLRGVQSVEVAAHRIDPRALNHKARSFTVCSQDVGHRARRARGPVPRGIE